MRSRTLTALFLGFVLVVVISDAQAHAQEGLTAFGSQRIFSRWVGPQGSLVSPDPVLWTDGLVKFPGGLSLYLWNSTGLASKPNSGYEAETDLFLNFGRTFEQVGIQGLPGFGFNVGMAYFALYDMGKLNDDLFQLYWEVNHKVKIGDTEIGDFLRVEYTRPVPWGDAGLSDNVLVVAGRTHSFPLGEGFYLNDKWTLSYHSGTPDVLPAAGIFHHDLGIYWKVTPRLTLELLNTKFAAPLVRFGHDLPPDSRKPYLAVGVGVNARLF